MPNKKDEFVNQNQIDNLDSQLEVMQTTLNKLTQKIVNLQSKWIVGEYRIMPIGSSMPEGWEKVDIVDGYTFIFSNNNENKDKNSKGQAGNITLPLAYLKDSWGDHYVSTSQWYGYTKKKVLLPVQGAWNGYTDEQPTNVSDKFDTNYAAGMYVEVWQYKGVD